MSAESSTDRYATGKRKTAVARIWIKPGTGQISVNNRPADEYFERETSRMIVRQSLELLELADVQDSGGVLCRAYPPTCRT